MGAYEELMDEGWPVDGIQRMIDERTARNAQIVDQVQGLARQYGQDFLRAAPEIGEMLSRPEWAELRDVAPVQTAEYLYLKTRQQSGRSRGASAPAQQAPAEQQRVTTDSDRMEKFLGGAIGHESGGDPHRARRVPTQSMPLLPQDIRRNAAEDYAHSRLRNVVSEDFLNR